MDRKEKYLHLWYVYDTTFAAVAKSAASKNAGGLESLYGQAAEQLMRVGQMYKIKAKYRGK